MTTENERDVKGGTDEATPDEATRDDQRRDTPQRAHEGSPTSDAARAPAKQHGDVLESEIPRRNPSTQDEGPERK